MTKFVITKSANGRFQFNLKTAKGQILLTSEDYASTGDCDNDIYWLRDNALNDACYEKKASANGKPYFNFTAINGQIIGTSQIYESTTAMNNGIELVKRNATVAIVVVENLS